MISLDTDTICAIATASGRGGIGVIRVSGKNTLSIIKKMTGVTLLPRQAVYTPFYEDAESDQQPVDQGIALFFPGPNSFTGEDVLELQAHGGPVILDILLRAAIKHGARLARPGEFSERAFLNDKIDLTQAEAIADLIDSVSEQAARSAVRSLQGVFSQAINQLVRELTDLRIYVEAAIDFPEEEIDFLADKKVLGDLNQVIANLDDVFQKAKQGALIKEGMTVVIAGKPNAGKSSLLNVLSGKDSAIVTDIAGTTRDVLKEHIQIDGMPLHIIDTAGLRESPDIVEQEGIKRAWEAIDQADHILYVVDSSTSKENNLDLLWPELSTKLSRDIPVTIIHNKSDLGNIDEQIKQVGEENNTCLISLSAKNNTGIDLLKQHLKTSMGYQGAGETNFTARTRHIAALTQAQEFLVNGKTQLVEQGAGELLAEDLRMAQQSLSEITGNFTSDDLLGEIFSSFCIGK